MTAPQPYRDPTYPPRQRRPEDPLRYDRDKHNQNSEFGFRRRASAEAPQWSPPKRGRHLQPKCPPVDVGPILTCSTEVIPYQPRRPRGEARVNGEQVRR